MKILEDTDACLWVRVKIGLDFVVVKVNLNVQEREGLIAGT